MTLTLNPGAVKSNVFPVWMVLVTGTTKLGWAGVLLAVWAPVRLCRIPVLATVLKGSWNVRSAEELTVLAT